MGFEHEIQPIEYDALHTRIVFDDDRVLYVNESEESDFDDEEYELYEELWEETPYKIERNYYMEALEDPPIKRYRHLPCVWWHQYAKRMGLT